MNWNIDRRSFLRGSRAAVTIPEPDDGVSEGISDGETARPLHDSVQTKRCPPTFVEHQRRL